MSTKQLQTLFRSGLASVVAFCLASTAFPAACPTEEEQEVVILINQERADQGLSPLEADVRLIDAARRHSRDMADSGFFDHTGSDGSSFWDRCVDAAYPMRSGGENIAAGYPTPAAAVQGWMNSPGHRAIILTPGYQDIGVGYVAGGPYGHYWTADFGVSSSGGEPPSTSCVGTNQAPIAVATAAPTAEENTTVTLDGAGSSDPDGVVASYRWVQTAGPPVELSGPGAPLCTFLTPWVKAGGEVDLMFQLTVQDNAGLEASTQVAVTVVDNTDGPFPPEPISFRCFSGDTLIVETSGGSVSSLSPLDPASLPHLGSVPASLPYGVVDLILTTDAPGDAVAVTFHVPAPASGDHTWMQYGAEEGWADYGAHAVFSADREAVTVTLWDGGIGDEDGLADGRISHKAGLGLLDATSQGQEPNGEPTADSDGDGSGGGGCFLQSVFF